MSRSHNRELLCCVKQVRERKSFGKSLSENILLPPPPSFPTPSLPPSGPTESTPFPCENPRTKIPPARNKDFGEHVLSHSVTGDLAAMRPPGCPLRAYGCRACRRTSYEAAGAAMPGGASAGRTGGTHVGGVGDVGKAGTEVAPGDGGGHCAARCPHYRLVCKSCQEEVCVYVCRIMLKLPSGTFLRGGGEIGGFFCWLQG